MPTESETLIELLEDIGDAIRDMTGDAGKYTLVQMPPAIRGIHDFYARGIRVTSAPSKTTYNAGESFDNTGMVVVRYDKHNNTLPVTNYTVSPTVLYESDTSIVLSWYFDEMDMTYTCTQSVQVNRVPSSIEVTAIPTKFAYAPGELFDSDGLEITCHYTGGTSDVVTGWTTSIPDGYEFVRADEGDYYVTVSYTENNTTCTASFRLRIDAAAANIPYHQNPSDYTWNEIITVANWISSLTAEELAVDEHKAHFDTFIGQQWLVGMLKAGTTLGDAEVSAENKKVYAKLIGVCHDDLTTPQVAGSHGKAAFTFMFGGALPYGYSMNYPTTNNTGGWANSKLRKNRLVAGAIHDAMPDELWAAAVSVEKKSNNVGQVKNQPYAAAVTATSELIWILAGVEVCGSETVSAFSTNAKDTEPILAEGSQYPFFAQANVRWNNTLPLAQMYLNKLNDGSLGTSNPDELSGTTFWAPSWQMRSAVGSSNQYFLRFNSDENGLVGRQAAQVFMQRLCFCVGDGSPIE